MNIPESRAVRSLGVRSIPPYGWVALTLLRKRFHEVSAAPGAIALALGVFNAARARAARGQSARGRAACRQQRKADILRTLTPMRAVPADLAQLRGMLEQWRAACRQDMMIGRQILAQLLDGERVVFTPTSDGTGWEFVAPCTLERVSIGAGLCTPQNVVAPTGFEPVFQRAYMVAAD